MKLFDDCIEVELHKAVNAIEKSIYLLETTGTEAESVENEANESEGNFE